MAGRLRKALPLALSFELAQPYMTSFWSGVAKDDSVDGCWEWTRARNRGGYGIAALQRKAFLAHRVAWTLAHGDAPELHVCHRCDNPGCCRPNHLFLGTDADNLADMRSKGRGASVTAVQRHGIEHHNAKLTPEAVAEMRSRHTRGEGVRALARAFNVAKSTAQSALRGLTWKDAS